MLCVLHIKIKDEHSLEVQKEKIYDLKKILKISNQKITTLTQYKMTSLVVATTTFGYLLVLNLSKMDSSTCTATKLHKGRVIC